LRHCRVFSILAYQFFSVAEQSFFSIGGPLLSELVFYSPLKPPHNFSSLVGILLKAGYTILCPLQRRGFLVPFVCLGDVRVVFECPTPFFFAPLTLPNTSPRIVRRRAAFSFLVQRGLKRRGAWPVRLQLSYVIPPPLQGSLSETFPP